MPNFVSVMIVINVKERKERKNLNFRKKSYDRYTHGVPIILKSLSETLETINSFGKKITFANVNMTFFKHLI